MARSWVRCSGSFLPRCASLDAAPGQPAPLLFDLTSSFVYCRLHGSEELYASGYSREALDQWAERVCAWAQGRPAEGGRRASATEADARPRDVYVYFDNDAKVHAPFDAESLQRKVEDRLCRPD